MIEKVEFHNFKALRDVSLDLERFTVLVGPNASGKTSVLEGLYCIAEFGRSRTGDARPLWRISLDQRTAGVEDAIRLVGSGEAGRVHVQVGPGGVSIDKEHAGGSGSGSLTSEAYRRGAKIPGAGGNPDFGPSALLRLETGRMVAASYSGEPVPRMESDGHGLPCVLAYMASNQPDTYAEIQSALRSVIPMVRGMRFPRARVIRTESVVITHEGQPHTIVQEREYWGNSIEFDMEGAPGIPGHMVSEGTLLVLGLLTVLMGPNRPRLVLLDDLDRALHPKAQEHVIALLRKLLDHSPHMQIVATSHSPYLLHHLNPDEVRLTALEEDGSVVCGRLDEHPDFEKWKEEMTPGELWSLFGEKWLLETRAGEQG